MARIIENLNKHFYILIFLLAAIYYFALLFIFDVKTDIQAHVVFVSNLVEGKDFPPNFLYYISVYVAALFQNNYQTLLFSSIIVLSFAITYKFFITSRILYQKTRIDEVFDKNRAYLISNAIAFSLITAFCIYLPGRLGVTKYFYLGQLPPNVWHNSTTIAVAPFALLLYWYSYELLKKFDLRNLLWIIGLVFLNNLIKPSFFFCFAVTFPLLALFRFKLKREFFLSLIPVVLGFVLIVWIYIMIYQFGSYRHLEGSSVVIAPFAWWRLYTLNIPGSLLVSVAFPLVYLIFYFKRVKNEMFLYYAYLLFAAAVIILILFAERGDREVHGNFLWQAVICNYILFFAVMIDFVENLLQEKKMNIKDMIIAAIFALHVASGWLYLIKIPFYHAYR